MWWTWYFKATVGRVLFIFFIFSMIFDSYLHSRIHVTSWHPRWRGCCSSSSGWSSASWPPSSPTGGGWIRWLTWWLFTDDQLDNNEDQLDDNYDQHDDNENQLGDNEDQHKDNYDQHEDNDNQEREGSWWREDSHLIKAFTKCLDRMLIFVCFLYQRKFLAILASREMCHLNWQPVIAYDHTLTGLPILR